MFISICLQANLLKTANGTWFEETMFSIIIYRITLMIRDGGVPIDPFRQSYHGSLKMVTLNLRRYQPIERFKPFWFR